MGTITGPTSSELIDVNGSEQLLDAEKAQSKSVISTSTEFDTLNRVKGKMVIFSSSTI